MPGRGGLEEKAGRWFAASAGISIVVVADADVIDWQQGAEMGIDCFNHVTPLRATGDIRLVAYDNEQKSSFVESAASLNRTLQKFHFLHRGWRIRLTVPHDSPIQDAVPVEKNGAAQS